MKHQLYVSTISAPSRAVWLMCEIDKIKQVQVVFLDILKTNDQVLEEKLNKNPMHTLPFLECTDGTVLWEAHTILRYLADLTESTLYPNTIVKRAIIDDVMDWCSRVLQPSIRRSIYPSLWPQLFGLECDEATDDLIRLGCEQLRGACSHISTLYLRAEPYVAGRTMTIADLTLATTIAVVQDPKAVFDIKQFPKVVEYLARMKKVPGWDLVHGEMSNGDQVANADNDPHT